MSDFNESKPKLTLLTDEELEKAISKSANLNSNIQELEVGDHFRKIRNEILLSSQPKDSKTIAECRELLKSKFPRILQDIDLLWGSQECHDKMTKFLWADSTNRQGFEKTVLDAINVLYNEHIRLFGFKKAIKTEKRDVW